MSNSLQQQHFFFNHSICLHQKGKEAVLHIFSQVSSWPQAVGGVGGKQTARNSWIPCVNIQMENSSGIFSHVLGTDRELLRNRRKNLGATECPGDMNINMCGRTVIIFWEENEISANLPLKQISPWCSHFDTADGILHIWWLYLYVTAIYIGLDSCLFVF